MTTDNKNIKEGTIRIGCASAFWGDTAAAAQQLVKGGRLDYLVFDYLAEVTMSIMAGAKMKNPEAGFAPDFVQTIGALLPEIQQQGIKVCSNAGGINPLGCAKALKAIIDEKGLDLTVAVVTGDNLVAQQAQLQGQGITEMFSGQAMPEKFTSVNAYLGAPGVSAALEQGADIVITGRVVDSALMVAPMQYEFGWSWSDYDQLAQASLAGHVIECGTQCTGGNFTDWHLVRDGYANMGFPIVECSPDGSFVVSKPDNTGGLISPHSVGEQILYEIGDPSAYILPDVVCDFTQVTLEQVGDNLVKVSGAKGKPCSEQYKVSATYLDGFRTTATFMIGGREAVEKGKYVANAIVDRVSFILKTRGLEAFEEVNIEVLGGEATYGEHAKAQNSREVIVKISVRHQEKKALYMFGSEIAQAATAMAPGITGLVGGRPKPSPRICLFSFLKDKKDFDVSVTLLANEETTSSVAIDAGESLTIISSAINPSELQMDEMVEVPLVDIAVARSGDKGDHYNIGVMARDEKFLPYIESALRPENVAEYMKHTLTENSKVNLYPLPGLKAFNLLVEHALGGGGVASLRIDPQGKAAAQQLLDMPVTVAKKLL